MNYFEHIDTWLETILEIALGEDDEQWLARVKKQIKDEILKSYRNGQKTRPQTSGVSSALRTESAREERPKRRFDQGAPQKLSGKTWKRSERKAS